MEKYKRILTFKPYRRLDTSNEPLSRQVQFRTKSERQNVRLHFSKYFVKRSSHYRVSNLSDMAIWKT